VQAAATAACRPAAAGGEPDRRARGGTFNSPGQRSGRLTGDRVDIGELIGGGTFGLSIDKNAPLKDPAIYAIVGTPTLGAHLPAKLTARHTYVQDHRVDGMGATRAAMRPPAISAHLLDSKRARSRDPRARGRVAGLRISSRRGAARMGRGPRHRGVCGEASWTDGRRRLLGPEKRCVTRFATTPCCP